MLRYSEIAVLLKMLRFKWLPQCRTYVLDHALPRDLGFLNWDITDINLSSKVKVLQNSTG